MTEIEFLVMTRDTLNLFMNSIDPKGDRESILGDLLKQVNDRLTVFQNQLNALS